MQYFICELVPPFAHTPAGPNLEAGIHNVGFRNLVTTYYLSELNLSDTKILFDKKPPPIFVGG